MTTHEDQPTVGGIEAHRKPARGASLSTWTRSSFRAPALTPQQRAEIQEKAAAIREDEPELSITALRRRLAVEYGVSLNTIRQLY